MVSLRGSSVQEPRVPRERNAHAAAVGEMDDEDVVGDLDVHDALAGFSSDNVGRLPRLMAVKVHPVRAWT